MMINGRPFVLRVGDVIVVTERSVEPVWDRAFRRYVPGPLQDRTVRVVRLLPPRPYRQRRALVETPLGWRFPMAVPASRTRLATWAELRGWLAERETQREAGRAARWRRRTARGVAWRNARRAERLEVQLTAALAAGESRAVTALPGASRQPR
jgi:hypothetical protein